MATLDGAAKQFTENKSINTNAVTAINFFIKNKPFKAKNAQYVLLSGE